MISPVETPRVGIYCRVSTTDQDVHAQLVRLNEADRRIHAVGNHWATNYVDDGVSGRLDSRPAFDRLVAEIRANRVDVVLAAKLDRLGRSAKAVLEFFDLCEQHGTRVVLVDQSIDTGTPVGRMLRTILAWVAEFEADLIAERTQQAMDAFKAGTRIPKGKVGHPVIATPEKVARAVALRRENPELTWSEIAQKTGLKRETVRRAVREATRTPAAGRPTVALSDGGRKVQTPAPTPETP